MRRLVLALSVACVALLLGGAVRGDAARERQITRETEESLDQTGRYVDFGVTLIVVRKDLDGGQHLIDGCARMTEVRRHQLGGMVDTRGDGADGRPCLTGPSIAPTIWFCSDQMEPLILHGSDLPPWILCTGGEGASKSTSLVQALYCMALKHVGHADRQIGAVAPTDKRMGRILEAIGKLWPAHWMVGERKKPTDRDGVLTFKAGPSVMFVSAHQQSKAEGSRIQGYNWCDAVVDEIQDCFDEWPNILARLRSAPADLPAQVFASCTAKDNTAWRNFKAACVAHQDGAWHIARVPGVDSPFVPQRHWDLMRNGGVTPREWLRRALGQDVGPEKAIYHCFARTLDDGGPGNLRPVPITAVDITAEVLAQHRPQSDQRPIGLLLGHDPGKRQHVTEVLKAYRFPGSDARPRWFVVDEIVTKGATIHAHAQAVLKQVRARWRCNLIRSADGRPSMDCAQVLVRIDPHSRAEKSEHPGPDVYAIWRSLGMLTKAAAYKPGTADPGVIPIESRLDMVNTLLCATAENEHEVRRLFIACDDRGVEAAPRLLAAFESMERDAGGKAENDPKDEDDLSHYGCAVGYALWMPEHARAGRAAA